VSNKSRLNVREIYSTGADIDPTESRVTYCSVGDSEPVKFLIDSGADASIIGERDWRKIKQGYRNGTVHLKDMVSHPNVNLSGYASDRSLEVVASFKAWIEGTAGKTEGSTRKPKTFTEFFVVKGGNRSLIGCAAALSMKILLLGPQVNAIAREMEEFPAIPDLEVDFDVDPTITPVRHCYVSIPIHFREQAMARIKEMERTGIIEKAEAQSKWMSGLSAVPKGHNDFRLVVNMRGPNRAIRRRLHYMPRMEHIRTKLHGALVFTKLDLSSAFHHIRLSKKASLMTTFITPDGAYRFKRLVFGVNCAPEIFQRQMELIMEGLENVIVYIDDILIYAKDVTQLRETTAEVLKRLSANNLTLNKDKCEYEKTSLTFLGHRLTSEGFEKVSRRED
jgi:Reverse transcriptase (RNA-dependent DNA polymerase)